MKPKVSVDFSISSTEELKNKIDVLSSLSDFSMSDVNGVEGLEFKINLNGRSTVMLNATIVNQWGGKTTVKVLYVSAENLQRAVNYLRGYYSTVWSGKTYDEKVRNSIGMKIPEII